MTEESKESTDQADRRSGADRRRSSDHLMPCAAHLELRRAVDRLGAEVDDNKERAEAKHEELVDKLASIQSSLDTQRGFVGGVWLILCVVGGVVVSFKEKLIDLVTGH